MIIYRKGRTMAVDKIIDLLQIRILFITTEIKQLTSYYSR